VILQIQFFKTAGNDTAGFKMLTILGTVLLSVIVISSLSLHRCWPYIASVSDSLMVYFTD